MHFNFFGNFSTVTTMSCVLKSKKKYFIILQIQTCIPTNSHVLNTMVPSETRKKTNSKQFYTLTRCTQLNQLDSNL